MEKKIWLGEIKNMTMNKGIQANKRYEIEELGL